MKELIFVRHAKSDWGTEFLNDIDRHLNERGYNDAYFLSNWFKTNKSGPDQILSSTATRAISTALIFARAMEFNMNNFKLEKNIYESKSEELISLIRKQDDALSSLMLFGHNPGFTDVCNELCDVYFDNLPTCGVISLHFQIHSWTEITPQKGKLNYHQFPKNFKNQD